MGWLEFVTALAVFFLLHSIPLHPQVRPWLQTRLGQSGFALAFSALSLAALAWLIGAADLASHAAIWDWAPWQVHVPLVVMAPFCLILAFRIVRPNLFAVVRARQDRSDLVRPSIVRCSCHPLWHGAHRPLFFCAGLCAMLAPAVWLWPGGLGTNPFHWHLHELLFGMGGAAVGGYLLTALPSWTGAGRVGPQSVRSLTLLWLLARLALPSAGSLPSGLVMTMALAYFAVLALILTRQLIAARVWQRLWLVGAIGGLLLGDAALLAGILRWRDTLFDPLALVLLFSILISAIGGRAVPAFTRSWLQTAAPDRNVHDNRVLSSGTLIATAIGGGMALAGQTTAAGTWLILAGVLQCLRLIGWQSLHTRQYPALLMLHLAWLWVPMGLILTGIAMRWQQVLPLGAATHGLTMGAMGTMILAIAGRAAMARQGGRLLAGRGLVTAFALVWLAALLRVLTPFVPQSWTDPVVASAALWMLGWFIFLWAYRPALLGPLRYPIFSMRR
jgi:uncharacterized protein involved in response to NO